MDFEKPSVAKELLINKILWVLPFLLIGLLLLGYSVATSVRYRAVRDKAVTLPATVCRVDEDYDVDNGTEYDVYVEYVYGGNSYTIRYIVSVSDMWLDRIGETVDITINPDKPTQQLEDAKELLFFAMFFGVPIFAVGVALFFKMRSRFTWIETYGFREQVIRRELQEAATNADRHPWLITAGFGYVFFGIFIVDIDSVGVGAVLLGIMLFVLLGVFTMLGSREEYKDDTPYVLVYSKVADRTIGKDSEGDAVYSVLLDDGVEAKWRSFDKKTYYKLEIGTELARIDCEYIHLQYRYDRGEQHYRLI